MLRKTPSAKTLKQKNETLKNEKLQKENDKLTQDLQVFQESVETLKQEKTTLENETLKQKTRKNGEFNNDVNVITSKETFIRIQIGEDVPLIYRFCTSFLDLQKFQERVETLKQKNQTLKNETLKQENETRENETLKQKNETLKNETLKQKNETLKNETLKQKNETLKNEILQQENDKLIQDLRDVEEKIKWREIRKATVEVTLRPDLAHRSLTVSKNRIITFTGEESAVWPIVRDSEGFTSGRRYWEVKVEGKSNWALGVSTHPDKKIIPEKPEEGYWLLRLGGGKYEAVSRSIVTISLPGKKQLRKVGVCLDYDEKKIEFYNVVDTNLRFHIHSIECGLSGQVYPIFSPGSQDRDPLIINTGNT
ncbi:UNVERIFIED_CONTAM: hypothetical protein FKN15_033913 [Acipenser sinensis]